MNTETNTFLNEKDGNGIYNEKLVITARKYGETKDDSEPNREIEIHVGDACIFSAFYFNEGDFQFFCKKHRIAVQES